MLVGHYHQGLVALSLVVATAAAYVALDLAGRVTAASGRARRAWLTGGATALGVGVWAMHYLGMLAYELPIPVRYDVPTVALSALPAVLASAVVLWLVSRDRLSRRAHLVGSLVMGCGIATMHFVGMEAMHLQAMHHYDAAMVALSVAVAVAVSFVALHLAFTMRAERRAFARRKLGSALLMGLAVAGMHYTGMAAVRFLPGEPHRPGSGAVDVTAIGIVAVVAVTVMVLGLALLSSYLDRRFGEQAEAIRTSEARYWLLFNRSLAGVYQSTLDGRLLDCNDALARTLGFDSREDALATGALAFYAAPQDRERWLAELAEHRTLPDFEHRLQRRDGRLLWVLESASLIDDPAGGPSIIEGTVVDITARRDAEQRLAEASAHLAASVERYRSLVETTNAVPWELDAATAEWRYLSPQVERIFGYEVEGTVGRPMNWEAIHADDRPRVRQHFVTLGASPLGTNLELEYRLYRKSGAVAYVRVVVVVAAEADGRRILRGISLDITAQRQMETELQQAQKLESVGRLAAGVAHEINTPVQFVRDSLHFVRDASSAIQSLVGTYQRLLLEAGSADAEALRRQAAAAESDADLPYLIEQLPQALALSLEGLDRVARIVRSMKEFARADTTTMAAVDLNGAIESTLTVARHEYRYVADVEVDFDELPPVVCRGGEINQVVLNIVVNAAHAIADVARGSDRRGRIGVRTRRDGDAVVVSVSDTGGGIPEPLQARVFDPFFTTKAVGRGTGQGLAIARAIVVDGHGGELRFETEPGVGTTFHVRLPLTPRASVRPAA